jgi:hypothetical protein
MLLNDRMAPTTNSVGFWERPLDAVVKAYTRWLWLRLSPARSVRPVSGPLEQLLGELEPLTPWHDRVLVVETKAGWTAYFDNGKLGTDGGAARALSRILGCRALIAKEVPHVVAGGRVRRYGSVYFALFTPADRGNDQRVVYAMNDGGPWKFYERGEPLPFEDTSQYGAKRIRDRFTPAMLETYCKAIGLEISDDGFYGPRGFILQERSPDGPTFSREELQRRWTSPRDDGTP